MYTKLDLEENKKMNEILKQNQVKMRDHYKKLNRQEKLLNIFMSVSALIFFIGLAFLISVIENMRF